MKIIIILFSIIFLCGIQANTATIEGSVQDFNDKVLLLLMTDNQNGYDTIAVDQNGNFKHVFECTSAKQKMLLIKSYADFNPIVQCYFTPGDKVILKLSKTLKVVETSDAKSAFILVKPFFSGDNVKENEYLNMDPPYASYKYNYEDGTPVSYKDFSKQVEAGILYRKEKLKDCNPEFEKEMIEKIIDYHQQFLFNYSRKMYDLGYNCSKDEDFMKELSKIDINNDNLSSQQYFNPIQSYIHFELDIARPELYKGDPEIVRTLKYIRDSIRNPKVQANISGIEISSAMKMGEHIGLINAFEIYKDLANNSEAFIENEKVFMSISKLLPGVKASDFVMEDVKGNTIRFTDIITKGRPTYVDFWATWCGPCCYEIPYLEKLDNHYNRDGANKIEFISISMDSDKRKWLEKVKNENPQWKQFIIPDLSKCSFVQEYNIMVIPRFMIFNGDGEIITINAIKPSDPQIIDYLDKILAR